MLYLVDFIINIVVKFLVKLELNILRQVVVEILLLVLWRVHLLGCSHELVLTAAEGSLELRHVHHVWHRAELSGEGHARLTELVLATHAAELVDVVLIQLVDLAYLARDVAKLARRHHAELLWSLLVGRAGLGLSFCLSWGLLLVLRLAYDLLDAL